MNDGHRLEQHLVDRFDQQRPLQVPAGAIDEQTVHVTALFWRFLALLRRLQFGHFVVHGDHVEGPALVGTRHLLSHGGEEALRIEEAGHPESGGTTLQIFVLEDVSMSLI